MIQTKVGRVFVVVLLIVLVVTAVEVTRDRFTVIEGPHLGGPEWDGYFDCLDWTAERHEFWTMDEIRDGCSYLRPD